MLKVITSFGKYSDAALLALVQAILAALTGNLNFPTPIPTLAIFEAAVDSYMAALSAASAEGGRTLIAAKNARKAELVSMLMTLANYINLTAAGNAEMLSSSAFPMQKSKEPLPPMGKPEIIKIENGVNSGEVKVTIKRLLGARNLAFQCTLDPLMESSEWATINTTLVKCTFSGLEAGKKYWFRVIAYGTDEQVVYSDPVLSRIIQ